MLILSPPHPLKTYFDFVWRRLFIAWIIGQVIIFYFFYLRNSIQIEGIKIIDWWDKPVPDRPVKILIFLSHSVSVCFIILSSHNTAKTIKPTPYWSAMSTIGWWSVPTDLLNMFFATRFTINLLSRYKITIRNNRRFLMN